VHFVLDWEFDSTLVSKAAGPLFAHAAGTLVDAFVERAMSMPMPPEEPPPEPPREPPPDLPPVPTA
jgi:hypothetical protein